MRLRVLVITLCGGASSIFAPLRRFTSMSRKTGPGPAGSLFGNIAQDVLIAGFFGRARIGLFRCFEWRANEVRVAAGCLCVIVERRKFSCKERLIRADGINLNSDSSRLFERFIETSDCCRWSVRRKSRAPFSAGRARVSPDQSQP